MSGHAFRVRGAASLADAADKVRNGAPLAVAGHDHAPRRVSTSSVSTTFAGNSAFRVLATSDGGMRTHQVRRDADRGTGRNNAGPYLDRRGRRVRDAQPTMTRLPIGGRIPNTSGWSNDAARGGFAAFDRPTNKRNGK